MAKKNGLKYNDAQRREYLNLTDRVGLNWLQVFEGDTEFYSAAFWDLLTGIWRAGGPVRKTDALGMMNGIKSVHTAGKYLETAIARGIILETDNPQDARSKLVALSSDMRGRLDGFFDAAVDSMCLSSREVENNGS
ncbi:MAG: hypothetical protein HQ512_10815 [Rhodospirillales bacterium]|nr:hypothetical protein [Rhodospirillales bacterium]